MGFKTAAFLSKKHNYIAGILALIGAFMLWPDNFMAHVWPIPPSDQLWMSLDPSWVVSLNYAKIKEFVWGSDFAFTYGPLGPFVTRIGWEENRMLILLFDLFLFVNFLFLFFLTVRESKNKLVAILAIVVVLVVLPASIGNAKVLILMALLAFWIRRSMDHPKPLYYFFQISIVVLLFFIKFNTGLIVFALYFAGIGYHLKARKLPMAYTIAYTILPFVLVIALAQLLHVSLAPYVASGIEFIVGYNDVMYAANPIPHSRVYALVIIGLLLGIITFNIWKSERKDYFKMLVILFLFGTSVFVLYKQAFVRADYSHIIEFFIFLPLITLCHFDLHRNLQSKPVMALFIVGLLLPGYFLLKETDNRFTVKEKFSKASYFDGFKDFTATSTMHIAGEGSQLPDAVKQKIGNATVDVYPWNAFMLFENKLNYLPRPIPQSYTAYTPGLEQKNFEHYNSADQAPQFVLYDYTSIDERYPLFDESKVNLALHKNYLLAEQFDFEGRKLLLLQKKPDFRPIRLTKIGEYETRLGKRLTVKEGIYYEVDIPHSLTGKLQGVISHAPEIQLKIKVKGRNVNNYRSSRLLLKTGFFSEDFVGSTPEAAQFFSHQPTLGKIAFLRFKALDKSRFATHKTITEYKIEQ